MFILFLSKHRELGYALDTALAAGKRSANCLLICGATDDSPLGLCDELSAWFIEPQLGCIHEGSCDLLFDGSIFVIHILCYYRSLTRGGAGVLKVSFT